MKKSELKEIIREMIQDELNEKAKWRSSSVRQDIPNPDYDDGFSGEPETLPRASTDVDLPPGALQYRFPHDIATQGPRKGMATKQSINRTKSNIEKLAAAPNVPSTSPAPPQVQKAASKEAGGKIVFGRYFDASGKYLGRSSGGKWIDAAQDNSTPQLESLLKLERFVNDQ